MAKFVFAYRGGGWRRRPRRREKAMAEWRCVFGSIGADLVDAGSPFGGGPYRHPDGAHRPTAAPLA